MQMALKAWLDDGRKASYTEVFVMRLGENIPATPPPYATIAPILHAQTHATPAQRGITLNTGAADADGR